MHACTCKLCGYTWPARVSQPKECPKCKRYDWNGDNSPSTPAEKPSV